MAWNPRQTYFYLVCFATLLMTLIGAVQLVQNALDLALPTGRYVPHPLELAERYTARPGADSLYSRPELEAMAEAQAQRMAEDQRRQTLRNLLGNLAFVLIAFPVYLYHWRKVRGSDA